MGSVIGRSLALGALVLAVGACSPTEPGTPATSAAAAAPRPPGPPLPIIIDTDLAADDVLAIMALLREPSVDIRAITIEGNGEAHCEPGMRNLTWLLGQFGVEGMPIGCGRAEPGPHGRLFPTAWRDGVDGFFDVAGPEEQGDVPPVDAVEVLADTLAASDDQITLVPLGPWTNLADLLEQYPDSLGKVAGIHAMAGAIDAPGNIAVDDVTPEHGVEWNVGVDPDAFAKVLETTDVPVTLVPLDATNAVPVPADFADIIGEDHAAAGADIAHRIYTQSPFLAEGSSFWDTLAALALVDPSLATWEDLTADVTIGGPSSGDVVRSATGRKIRAAMDADQERFMAQMLAALRRGDPRR